MAFGRPDSFVVSLHRGVNNPPFSYSDETADWEKELQQELQEYEVVTEEDHKDDQWDQEIEKMLQADDS